MGEASPLFFLLQCRFLHYNWTGSETIPQCPGGEGALWPVDMPSRGLRNDLLSRAWEILLVLMSVPEAERSDLTLQRLPPWATGAWLGHN